MAKKLYITFSTIAFIIILFSFKSIILYQTALFYCKTKNLSTTGEAIFCHYEFMNKFDKNTALEYLKARDYCYMNTKNQYETSICTDARMMRLK